MSGKILLFSIIPTLLPWLRVEDANFPDMSLHMINDEFLFQLCLSIRYVKVPAALCYLCIKMLKNEVFLSCLPHPLFITEDSTKQELSDIKLALFSFKIICAFVIMTQFSQRKAHLEMTEGCSHFS